MLRFKKVFLALLLIIGAFSPAARFAQAQSDVEAGYKDILEQGIIFAEICDEPVKPNTTDTCACRAYGTCSLGDVMQIFINISIIILGLSGTIVLVMFIYGGLMWILAGGNEKRVTEGKETLVHAVIGLAIIFGAYAIVNYVIAGIVGRMPSATIEDTIKDVTGDDTAGDVVNSE